MRPLLLPANQPRACYRGAGRIAAFRGLPATDPARPEDWVASTTTRLGQPATGLTTLPDGRVLRAAVGADPLGWLGRDHADRVGGDPGLLVKLLDAGERLPLHVHPDRDFARSRLAATHGRNEAWVILQAPPDAALRLGFRRDVGAGELMRWVSGQQVGPMLDATHRVPVRAGDAVLVPAGTPHAVEAGILLVALQEPTDLSVLLEREGYALEGVTDGHLGLGVETALECVDRRALPPHRIDAQLRGPAAGRPVRDGVRSLLPPAADPFFRAECVEARPRVLLDAGFAVLVVLAGSGLLVWDGGGGVLETTAGDTVLVPHGAGPVRVEGPLTAVRCRPPSVQPVVPGVQPVPPGARPAPVGPLPASARCRSGAPRPARATADR